MATNRLKLNFDITGSENRAAFIQTYLTTLDFAPTPAELETIADYILWGDRQKTTDSGIVLTSYLGAKKADVLSLDDLRESPAFNESSVRPLSAPALKVKRETFSRAEARRKAPPEILAALEALWTEISQLEAQLEDESLGPYRRLKLRRLLVEKRRSQYHYRDFYSTKPSRFIPPTYSVPSDNPIEAFPATKGNAKLDPFLFPEGHLPLPQKVDPETAKIISAAIWRRSQSEVDLTNPDHIEAVLKAEILSPEELPFDTTYPQILSTANYFLNLTPLSDLELEVLRRKLAGEQNQPIAADINVKFSKTHNPNYISTIYKKALKKVAETASLYRDHLEAFFIPESFKVCKDCGATLLIDERNFMRRRSSKDGFAPICKRCSAERRRRSATQEGKDES